MRGLEVTIGSAGSHGLRALEPGEALPGHYYAKVVSCEGDAFLLRFTSPLRSTSSPRGHVPSVND